MISEKELNTKIKRIFKENPFFKHLFNSYGVEIGSIDKNLMFQIKALKGKYSEADSNVIILNEKIIDNLFTDNFHFVIHELVHWLTRQREKIYYFSDPEEAEAFSLGMAFELLRGQSKQKIVDTFFPIIESHFNDKDNAKQFFNALFTKAILISRDYNL